MPDPLPANAEWQYDYIDHYRLDVNIIDSFLCGKWGNYKWNVKAGGCQGKSMDDLCTDLAQRKGDEFKFWVPRALDKVGF